MKKIVFFGNCQAWQLNNILSKSILSDGFSLQYLANNASTGGQKSLSETLAVIASADFLFYQPLREAHGGLCEANILQTIKSGCAHFSFSYIFNSGICALCEAPQAGKIFGSHIIAKLLQTKSRQEIHHDFEHGLIDFDLPNRFQFCLSEMVRRETATDIKLADFIASHYQETKLFTTHNHPNNSVLFECLRQIQELSGIAIKKDLDTLRIKGLPKTNCHISPFDKAALGYRFAADADWLENGKRLIDKIIDGQ